jgi:hypothetical protein
MLASLFLGVYHIISIYILKGANMAATKYNFSIEQGTSFRLSLTYKDKDKNPINITNYCARLIL